MRGMILAVLIAALLAACGGGGGDPTQQITTNNGTPVLVENPTSEAFVIVTLAPAADATEDLLAGLPGVGTLEAASATEDPNIELVFDQVELFRYSGENGEEPITMLINQDGTFTRNGVAGRISQDRVTQIDTLLDTINFFALQANYISLAESRTLKYRLRVVRGANERTIDSEEGFMPSEYMVLLGEILNVGIVP